MQLPFSESLTAGCSSKLVDGFLHQQGFIATDEVARQQSLLQVSGELIGVDFQARRLVWKFTGLWVCSTIDLDRAVSGGRQGHGLTLQQNRNTIVDRVEELAVIRY